MPIRSVLFALSGAFLVPLVVLGTILGATSGLEWWAAATPNERSVTLLAVLCLVGAIAGIFAAGRRNPS